MILNDNYALYTGPYNYLGNPTTYFTLANTGNTLNRGFVLELEFCVDVLPRTRTVNIFNKNSSLPVVVRAQLTTSNKVFIQFRVSSGVVGFNFSENIVVGKKYKLIVNFDVASGVKALLNGEIIENTTSPPLDVASTDITMLYATALGSMEQMQGWIRNIRVFNYAGILSDIDINTLWAGGNYVENRILPLLLKDKAIYELRCNQESGNTIKNTAFLGSGNQPIIISNPSRGIKGGGLWRQVEFEEEIIVDDFEPIYQLAMVNAVPENWQTREEADVLQLNYVHDPVNYQFSATTTNGSWVKSDVPLESRIVGDLVFSTTDGAGANVLSLVDGQTDGIAFWFSSTNNFRMSIFHSGGTQEIFNFGTGAVPYDETEVNIRFLIYNNAGTQAIKIWTRIGGVDTLVVNSVSANLIDGFLYQLGQFKNTTSNRLNGATTPTLTEGIKSCVIWRVNKATQPSDAEVLALTQPVVPESRITRYEITTITGVAGMLMYVPPFFDNSGATKYPVMIVYGGAGDGRNTTSLTELSKRTVMDWLKRNDVEFIVLQFQSTTTGWEDFDRVPNTAEFTFNETTGFLKDYVNYSNTMLQVAMYGYSAGANGLDHMMSSASPWLPRINVFVPVAGNLADAETNVAALVANGNYVMIFCATNDGVSGTITSKNMAETMKNSAPTKVSIVEFSDLDLTNEHSAIQDLVYNNLGNVEPQQSGSYGTTGEYRVWVDTTWWNDVRTILNTGTL